MKTLENPLPAITPEMERLAEETRKSLESQKSVTLEEARKTVPENLRTWSPLKEG
jgi:hypothetical protein